MSRSLVPSPLSTIIITIRRHLGHLGILILRHVFQFLMKHILMATLSRFIATKLIKPRLIYLVDILNVFLLPLFLVESNPLEIGHIVL